MIFPGCENPDSSLFTFSSKVWFEGFLFLEVLEKFYRCVALPDGIPEKNTSQKHETMVTITITLCYVQPNPIMHLEQEWSQNMGTSTQDSNCVMSLGSCKWSPIKMPYGIYTNGRLPGTTIMPKAGKYCVIHEWNFRISWVSWSEIVVFKLPFFQKHPKVLNLGAFSSFLKAHNVTILGCFPNLNHNFDFSKFFLGLMHTSPYIRDGQLQVP